jgi:hypothetical protein
MSKFIIELGSNNNGGAFDMDTSLSGVIYHLKFKFNSRLGGWYFGIYTAAREPIATGLNVVTDYYMTARVTDSRKPVGHLYFLDTSGQKLPPTANAPLM